jgi:hypothetical protein
VQGVFLSLLSLARHRLQTDATAVPREATPPLDEFDRGVRQTLEAIADAVEGKATRPLPDMRGALEELARVDAELSAPTARVDVARLTHFKREVTIRRHVLAHVERLARL